MRCCFWLGNLRRIVLRKSVQLFNHLKRICLPRHRVQEVPDNDNLYLCVSVPVNPCESVFDPPSPTLALQTLFVAATATAAAAAAPRARLGAFVCV